VCASVWLHLCVRMSELVDEREREYEWASVCVCARMSMNFDGYVFVSMVNTNTANTVHVGAVSSVEHFTSVRNCIKVPQRLL
jgi:hypothetical protein